MGMTHKDALDHASKIYFATMPEFGSDADMEAAIRAYLDARGLVMVPKSATMEMECRAVVKSKPYHDLNWRQQMPKDFFRLVWPHLLAAAPDPFKEATP